MNFIERMPFGSAVARGLVAKQTDGEVFVSIELVVDP